MSRKLCGQLILGADFMSGTKMFLDVGSCTFYFTFATCVMFKFIQFKTGPSLVQKMSVSSQFAPSYSSNLSL